MENKSKYLVFVIILLIGFIVNSCDGNDEKQKCECDPKEHDWDDDSCCGIGGEDCCTINARPHECNLANPHDGECEPYCPDGKGNGECTHRGVIRCDHAVKAHKGVGEDCHTGVTLDENCTCVLQEYGELFEGSGIKIYRVGADNLFGDVYTATAAAQNAKDGYEGMSDSNKLLLEGKVDEIHIFPVTDDAPTYFYKSEGGKLIVGFRSNRASAQMRAMLNQIASDSLTPEVVAQILSTKGIIRMAKAPVNADLSR